MPTRADLARTALLMMMMVGGAGIPRDCHPEPGAALRVACPRVTETIRLAEEERQLSDQRRH